MSERVFERIDGRATLVSSARIEPLPFHDCVRLWNRGGLCGELMLMCGDGMALIDLLLPPDVRKEVTDAES